MFDVYYFRHKTVTFGFILQKYMTLQETCQGLVEFINSRSKLGNFVNSYKLNHLYCEGVISLFLWPLLPIFLGARNVWHPGHSGNCDFWLVLWRLGVSRLSKLSWIGVLLRYKLLWQIFSGLQSLKVFLLLLKGE